MTRFGQSLLECHASLYRYARALCHDPVKAEELVQETYSRALAAKRRPDPAAPDQVRPWVFTIMRNLWHNQLRRRGRECAQDLIEESEAGSDRDTPETLLTRKLLRSEIVEAIDALPEMFREVIVLREIEGLSYAEIAQVLDCPRGTVMSRLARARAALRRLLIRFAPPSREVSR